MDADSFTLLGYKLLQKTQLQLIAENSVTTQGKLCIKQNFVLINIENLLIG